MHFLFASASLGLLVCYWQARITGHQPQAISRLPPPRATQAQVICHLQRHSMLGTGLGSDEVKAKKHVLSSLGAYSQVREKGLWTATLPCAPCSAREAQVWPRRRGGALAVGDRDKAVSYPGKERVKTL